LTTRDGIAIWSLRDKTKNNKIGGIKFKGIFIFILFFLEKTW
jgi:hypothetical protein